MIWNYSLAVLPVKLEAHCEPAPQLFVAMVPVNMDSFSSETPDAARPGGMPNVRP